MWLLSTNGLQLVHFHSPDVVPGGYAILSHVWQGAEQSFSDIQLLISQHSSLRDPFVSVKIKETCYIAFNHGYDWVWIDTCCIDKSSSAELSEAINSMFEWYSKAQVCYVYLHDVPHSCHIHAPNSSFRQSKWFTRGWTLQELIAPRYLIFLSSDWLPLGTKSALADLVQDISGVDVDVLTFTRDVTNVSVARRMSWASRRFTTRLEDEAYSLMGIFAINMTTMYGEGAGAFRRLQEEILRHTDDHTLFAWGKMFEGPDVPPGLVTDTQDLTNYLFAPSPSAFKNSAHMCPAPPSAVATAMKTFFPQKIDVEYTTTLFTITAVGVRCYLPVANGGIYAFAILNCQDEHDRIIGFVLHHRAEGGRGIPHYHVGASFMQDISSLSGAVLPMTLALRSIRGYRLLPMHYATSVLSELNGVYPPPTGDIPPLGPATCQVRELYIMHFPPRAAHPWLGLYAAEPKDFFIPKWVNADPSRYGFQMTQQSSPPTLLDHEVHTLSFSHKSRGECFTIVLGRCQVHLHASVSIEHSKRSHAVRRDSLDAERVLSLSRPSASSRGGFNSPGSSARTESVAPARVKLKARVAHLHSQIVAVTDHDCPEDHIRFWNNASKSFGDMDRRVQLTFSRWPNPDSYCLDIRLCGRIYDTLLKSSE